MISVLIETRNQDAALARTLSSLVAGAVEGLVREVIVCDAGSCDGTLAVADEAGCVVVQGRTAREATADARGDWLLFLPAGARFGAGWTGPVGDHCLHASRAARFTPARKGWRSFWSGLGTRDPAACGLLVRRQDVQDRLRPVRLDVVLHLVD